MPRRPRDEAVKVSVFSHYGYLCVCCGETEPMFLSIDHINNDGALYKLPSGKRLGGMTLYRWIVKNNYPDTLRVLCHNCNLGRHMNGGTCPHELTTIRGYTG